MSERQDKAKRQIVSTIDRKQEGDLHCASLTWSPRGRASVMLRGALLGRSTGVDPNQRDLGTGPSARGLAHVVRTGFERVRHISGARAAHERRASGIKRAAEERQPLGI